jgi:TonB family protein
MRFRTTVLMGSIATAIVGTPIVLSVIASPVAAERAPGLGVSSAGQQDERQLEARAHASPGDPSAQHVLATYYFEKSKDPQLEAKRKQAYLQQAMAAEDRALAADPVYFDALVYKSLILRELAARDANPTSRQALLAEAEALRARAVSVRGASASPPTAGDCISASAPVPPPPPPVPGAGEIKWVYAETSFTASGNARELKKVKDVRPVYPPMAIRFGVQGTVVVEAVLGNRGEVSAACIVGSVPMLNQSAIDAVRQWRFDPATVAPSGDRVVLTVKATFTPPR